MEKEQLTYTLILHEIRKQLKLTLMEYCVADSIYHLSNNPNSQIKGWCYASKETIARILGTTRPTIFEVINKLIRKDLIEKDEETKYLKTTDKWYQNVVLVRSKAEYKETLQGVKKGYSRLSRKATTGGKERLPNIYKYNKNNKDSISLNNFPIKEIEKTGSYAALKMQEEIQRNKLTSPKL